jgi:hypothetical protein
MHTSSFTVYIYRHAHAHKLIINFHEKTGVNNESHIHSDSYNQNICLTKQFIMVHKHTLLHNTFFNICKYLENTLIFFCYFKM